MIKEICHFRFQFFRIWIFGGDHNAGCFFSNLLQNLILSLFKKIIYIRPILWIIFSVNNCLVNMFEHLYRALLIIITSNNRLEETSWISCVTSCSHLIDFCKERIQIAIYCQ